MVHLWEKKIVLFFIFYFFQKEDVVLVLDNYCEREM